MSKYNYEDSPAPKQSAKFDIWNILSILTLLFTLCLAVYFVAVFISPASSLNPFQGSFGQSDLPTSTITPIPLPATWTTTPFVAATEMATLLPTHTLEPSPTLFSLVTPTITFTPTKEPTPTKTPKAPFSATVTYIASSIIHPEAGCKWQGIGGTVVDANNTDMLRITIRLTGSYDGKSKNELTVSSIAPAYGKSGYEFFLGTIPINSRGNLSLQLLDQAGLPLSDSIDVDMFEDCSKNLVLVRFKKKP